MQAVADGGVVVANLFNNAPNGYTRARFASFACNVRFPQTGLTQSQPLRVPSEMRFSRFPTSVLRLIPDPIRGNCLHFLGEKPIARIGKNSTSMTIPVTGQTEISM